MGFRKDLICISDKSKSSAFDCDCDTIKGYLCDIANSYLLIAFRVWEINLYGSYKKAGYKSIVDAMSDRLGFKKSTVYNLLHIVDKFGRDDKGEVTYNRLICYNSYSYSQLCEMLSMSTKQLDIVAPDMSVKEMRAVKKVDKAKIASEVVQTSGKPVISSEVVQASRITEDQLYDKYSLTEWCSLSYLKRINKLINFINSHGLLDEFFCSVSDCPVDDIDAS